MACWKTLFLFLLICAIAWVVTFYGRDLGMLQAHNLSAEKLNRARDNLLADDSNLPLDCQMTILIGPCIEMITADLIISATKTDVENMRRLEHFNHFIYINESLPVVVYEHEQFVAGMSTIHILKSDTLVTIVVVDEKNVSERNEGYRIINESLKSLSYAYKTNSFIFIDNQPPQLNEIQKYRMVSVFGDFSTSDMHLLRTCAGTMKRTLPYTTPASAPVETDAMQTDFTDNTIGSDVETIDSADAFGYRDNKMKSVFLKNRSPGLGAWAKTIKNIFIS